MLALTIRMQIGMQEYPSSLEKIDDQKLKLIESS